MSNASPFENDYRSVSAQVEMALQHTEARFGMDTSAAKNAADSFVEFLEQNKANAWIVGNRKDLSERLLKIVKVIPVSDATMARASALIQIWEAGEETPEAPSGTYQKLNHQLRAVFDTLTADTDRTHIGAANVNAQSAIEGLKTVIKEVGPLILSPGDSDQIFSLIHLIQATPGSEKFNDLIGTLNELQGKLPPKSPGY